jgi:phage baseplate assembly protein V
MLFDLKIKISEIVQVGEISEVNNSKSLAKVNILGVKTDFMPVLAIASADFKLWVAPTVGEQVLVLRPDGGEKGFILRGVYSRKCKEPASASGHHVVIECKDDILIEMKDGASISYKNGTLSVDKIKKMSIKNESGDYVKTLNGVLRSIYTDAKVPTLMGPQNIVNPKFEKDYVILKSFEG